MPHSLVRSPGRSAFIHPLAVALTALLALSTLACGRSGLRSLGGTQADGGPGGSGPGSAGASGGGTSGGGTNGMAGTSGGAGRDGGAGTGGRRVVGIAVAPALITVGVGGVATYSATLQFSDGTTSDATASAMWTSSNVRVATVFGGRATALTAGNVQITAASMGFSASAALRVVQAITLVSINVEPGATMLPVGAKQAFTVTGFFSDGTTADVTAMAKWSTDQPGLIGVDAGGVVTALKAGTATLLATVGTLMGKAAVFVSGATVVQLSVLPPLQTIGVGTRAAYTADATLSDGTHANVTAAATWSVDDAMVAAIDRGLAAGAAPGKTVVRASFGGATGTATLVVTAATLKTLQIDPVDPVVGVGVALDFRATGILSDGTKVDLTAQVMWASSAPSVVVPLDGMGHTVTKSVGTSVITATTQGLTAKSTVTVTPASLKAITVTPVSATLSVGGSVSLRAIGTFSDGSTADITSTVTWTVMPAGVVTVSNALGTAGLVKALAAGSASVVASSGGVTGGAKIIVSPATLQSITIVPQMASVPIGAAVPLAAQGTFSDGTTRDVTAEVFWDSTDDAIATVGNAPGTPGLVTGVKAGTVTIFVTAANGAAAKAIVNVAAATLKGIVVSPIDVTTTAGLRSNYTATGIFSDGSKVDVTAQATWSTADATVATISNVAGASGQLLARAAGMTIVAASLDGVTGETTVTVTGPTASSLAIAPIAVSTPLGTAVQYTATLILSNGTTRNVTGPADWTSSNPMAATINGMGRAQPVAVGTTTITATYMGFSAMTTLGVTNAVAVSVEVTPIAPTMPVGTMTQFQATAIFSDGTTRNVTAMATWMSSKPGVVGVTTMRMRGAATAVAPGTAVITATFMGLQGDTTVTVTDSVIVEISVSPQGVTMPVGSRRQFTAQAIRSDGTSMAITGVATWQSDAPGVAAVSTAGGTRGQVTGVGGGTATISASYMGVTGSVTVTVTPATLTAVQVTPFSPTISPSTQLQFVATALFSDGTSVAVTGMATWQSSDDAVAGVSNAAGTRGLATGLLKGATTISATYMNLKASTVLQVTDATITQIQVTPFAATIPESFQRQFTATAIYSDGTNREITSQATWTSSDSAVALVSNALPTKGLVVASAGGPATIKAQYGGVEGSTAVTVSAAQLAAIKIAPNPGAAAVGMILPFTATGSFDDGSTLDITTFVTWTSSDLDVADVSNADGTRGQATAFGPGTTTIQAQRGAVTATATLTVK